MAHLITTLDKTFSIRGDRAWHGMAITPQNPDGTFVENLTANHLGEIFHPIIPLSLASDGTAFEGSLSAETVREIQALVNSGDIMGAFLRSRAALYPERLELPDWKGVAADMRHAGGGIVPLAVHGDGYKEIENAAFWAAKERALKNTPHCVTTAGTLDGCKRFYICIELPDSGFDAAGEKFKEFLCIVTSHDGTMAAQAFISRVRIVCNNTFTAAEAGTNCRLRVKHTKNADAEFVGLEKFIQDAHAGRAKFCGDYLTAKETKLEKNQAMAAITGFFFNRTVGRKNITTGRDNARLSTRVRNQIDEIFQAFLNGAGNDGQNVADLMNGFTDHYSNGSGVGLTKGGVELTPLEKHGASQWGSPMEIKTEISRLLLQPDGTALRELIQVGETKGRDAYLEGTGKSAPVFLSGLERSRKIPAPAPARVIDFSGDAAPAPAPLPVFNLPVTPAPSTSGISDFASLLGGALAPKV